MHHLQDRRVHHGVDTPRNLVIGFLRREVLQGIIVRAQGRRQQETPETLEQQMTGADPGLRLRALADRIISERRMEEARQ